MPVIINNNLETIIAAADTIKQTSEAVKMLKELGLSVYMITGDNLLTARLFAEKAGIDNVIAELVPQNKAYEIEKAGKKVIMAGNSINSATALVSADIGVAMSSGTDIAIEAYDIFLLNGDTLSPILAGGAMALSSVSVVTNSLSLKRTGRASKNI